MMMAKLLRVFIALTSFILLYNLFNGQNPEFLRNQGLTTNQIDESAREAIKEVIGDLAPDLQISTDLISTRFELNNNQLIANGMLIPDVQTDMFISKLGDYSLSVNLRTVKKLGEEDSFEVKHKLDVYVENNWIVFEAGDKFLSYFAKVIGLDCKHPEKQFLLELVCMKNEPIISSAKVVEVELKADGKFQFKDNRYSYLKTIYKASSNTD